MKYRSIAARTKSQIVAQLGKSSDDETICATVLAAIYHHDSEFAGDILLGALRTSRSANRLALFRMIHTFLQMHKTTYLAAAFLDELQRNDLPGENQPEIMDLIEGVIEFQAMFGHSKTPATRPI